MNKILLILSREYLTRVRKKSFIVMTILGPILMAALFVVPIWLAMGEKSKHLVAVIDDSGITAESQLPDFRKTLKYDYPGISKSQALKDFYNTDYTIILWIPENFLTGTDGIVLYYKKQPGIIAEETIRNDVENARNEILYRQHGISLDTLRKITTMPPVKYTTEKRSEDGKTETTSTGVSIALGFGSAILIYMFIFLYGVQVMRGVIEEKISRIVEVIISSVKPFQLMMGKIIGVAMVGLTQFIIWVVMTGVLIGIAQATLFKGIKTEDNPIVKSQQMKPGMNMTNFEMPGKSDGEQKLENAELTQIYMDVMSRNYPVLIAVFIFYFLGGYLLYSALFAAVGAAVDNETETQQFMLPITIPLIFAFVMAQAVMQDPESPLGFWLSVIPFTSPVIMMVRLPFGVPAGELALSMCLLIAGFIFTTWLAGRIYRTGILMYGKKVTWRELGKWLFYKG
ncbi:MAG: ABC transporter permease [Bacteroidota bacterium]